MKRLVIGVAAAAVVFITAASASAHEFTIRGDWKLGSFAVKRDGTLRGAIDAFGRPGSKERDGVACVVRWPRHGLKIQFYNLGGQPVSACVRLLLSGPRPRPALADGSGTRNRRPAAAPQEPVPERAVPLGRARLLARGLVARTPMVVNRFRRLLPRPARDDAGPARRPVPRSVSGRRRLSDPRGATQCQRQSTTREGSTR